MKNTGVVLVLFVVFYLIGEFGLLGVVFVAGLGLIGWYISTPARKQKKRGKAPRNQNPQAVSTKVESNPDRVEVGTSEDIVRAWARGDYQNARKWLQKVAYRMVRPDVTDRQRQVFKQLVAEFAVQDPLYYELLSIIRPAVNQQPGILQSQLTKSIEGYSTEHIRYVLYYAHELGDIHRVKHGRTYKLYLPGETLEGEVEG